MRQHVHPLPALRFPFDLGMRLDLKQGDDPIYLSDLYVFVFVFTDNQI